MIFNKSKENNEAFQEKESYLKMSKSNRNNKRKLNDLSTSNDDIKKNITITSSKTKKQKIVEKEIDLLKKEIEIVQMERKSDLEKFENETKSLKEEISKLKSKDQNSHYRSLNSFEHYYPYKKNQDENPMKPYSLSDIFKKMESNKEDEIETETENQDEDKKSEEENKNEDEKKSDEKKSDEKKSSTKRNRTKRDNEKDKDHNYPKKYNNNLNYDPFNDLPGVPPIVITLLGIKKNNGDDPDLEKEQEAKKKKIEEEDFYDYFTQASELTPIEKEIKTLQDLIDLGKTYDPTDLKRYVIQMKALHKCIPVLEELNHMIGMKNVKSMIMDLLFFRLQNIEDREVVEKKKEIPQSPLDPRYLPFGLPPGGKCGGDDCEEEGNALNVCNMETLSKEHSVLRDMYHMVITGSPGCGKTEVAKILAKLYYCLGIAKKDKFTLARRSDLIGKFLGHTAKMTQDVFNKAKGGILFIDEAYALGNPEGRDSFSKECIDTINQNLTENKDTVVFIAGYKNQLEESFFAYNPGLHRRFKFRLEVDKYDASELRLIYMKKIQDSKWNIYNNDPEKSIPLSLFEKNRDIFKFNGGDMENLWHLTKIVHARRIFGKSRDLVKKINEEDVKKAITHYMENDEVKKRNDDIKKYIRDTIYV
jgi:hypothetical protein